MLLLCLHEDKTSTVALVAPLFANSDKHTNLLSQSINCLSNTFYNEDPYTKWKIFDFFLNLLKSEKVQFDQSFLVPFR